MRRRPLHLSPQMIDPVGGIVDAPIVIVGAVVTTLTAVLLTAAHWSEVRYPAAAALGVLLVVAAAIVMYGATRPARAPFTPERLGLIVTLAVGAAVAEFVSTAGANRFLYDDYGAVVVGLLILSLAPFCTWVSLVVAGLLATGVSTILVLGAAPTTETNAPVISLVAVNAALILALTAAAAAYSAAVVREVLAWQRESNARMLRRDAAGAMGAVGASGATGAERVAGVVGAADVSGGRRAARAAGSVGPEGAADAGAADVSAGAPAAARAAGAAPAAGAARVPHQEPSRVSVLRREVLPFLARVTTLDHLSRADADRARELTEALRRALRAGVEATWLDDLAESVRRAHGTPMRIVDRAGDARRLDDHQRAAVSAVLRWVGDPGRATGVGVEVERAPGARVGRITVAAEVHEAWRPRRRELDRFVALARIVGMRARAFAAGENVTVEFDYAID